MKSNFLKETSQCYMYILQEHVLYSERIAMVYDITSIINECMIFSFFRKNYHPDLRINKRIEQDFFSNRIITLSSRGVNKKNTITDFMFAVTIAFFLGKCYKVHGKTN